MEIPALDTSGFCLVGFVLFKPTQRPANPGSHFLRPHASSPGLITSVLKEMGSSLRELAQAPSACKLSCWNTKCKSRHHTMLGLPPSMLTVKTKLYR